MKINRLNSIIILGLVAIIGILIAQLLWTKEAFTLEEKKFSQKVYFSLLEVANHLQKKTNHKLPSENPVKKISNDYYVVNVGNDFDPEILEYYLKNEFKEANITTDFEYAVYNCESDKMIYGNYISFTDKLPKETSVYFQKHKNLIYYFVIHFPSETPYLFKSLHFWVILSFALIIILLVYVYSIYTILQQREFSELQRDFINNMTHEFKTPLSSILIASNYLKQQKNIKSDKKLEKYTDIIINQSTKLNNHIEKILNIAKWDNSSLVLDTKEIAIIPVLNEVIENIQLKYQNVVVKINSQKEYYIQADIFHFTNIIYNLIDNSVKYCETNPEITIRIFEENQTIKIKFIDNGIGISNNDINYIFDKFYRVPSTKSNQINGFGLGLYYVKKICLLHHWTITVMNNSEKGITITITIPNK